MEIGYCEIEHVSRLSQKVNDTIKCLIFDVYRGVSWKRFGTYLKKCFPKLETLYVRQAYTIDCNAEEFFEFMNDPWLKSIFIYTTQDTFVFENTLNRIFHSSELCKICSKLLCPIARIGYNIHKQIKPLDLNDYNSDFMLDPCPPISVQQRAT